MSKDAPSGRSGTGTGVAPATSIMARYVGKPGSGYITSSPGCTSARVGKKRPGLAPGPTTTCAGEVATPRVRVTYSAMARLRFGMPDGLEYLVLPPVMASTPASTTCAGDGNPGWPISRWTMSLPFASRAFAAANTAYAPSFCSEATRSVGTYSFLPRRRLPAAARTLTTRDAPPRPPGPRDTRGRRERRMRAGIAIAEGVIVATRPP